MKKQVYNAIFCKTVNGQDMVIRKSSVDAYISISEDTVRVYMNNGNIIECMNDVDQDVYPGEDLGTLFDEAFGYSKA